MSKKSNNDSKIMHNSSLKSHNSTFSKGKIKITLIKGQKSRKTLYNKAENTNIYKNTLKNKLIIGLKIQKSGR